MGSKSQSEILIQEETPARSDSLRYWKRLVDTASLIWLAAFLVSVFSYSAEFVTVTPAILNATDTITLLLLPIFIADLALKYRLSENSRTFLKKHWLAVIYVVPYFRIFKVLKFVRIAGIIRLNTLPRTWGVLLNAAKAVYRALRLGRD